MGDLLKDPLFEWAWRLFRGSEGVFGFIFLATILGVIMAKKGWLSIILGGRNGGNGGSAEAIVRKHLYNDDGTAKFTTAGSCREMREGCAKDFCDDLKDIKASIENIHALRTAEAKDRNEELRKISLFMGGVEEFMRTVRDDLKELRKK